MALPLKVISWAKMTLLKLVWRSGPEEGGQKSVVYSFFKLIQRIIFVSDSRSCQRRNVVDSIDLIILMTT